MAKNGDGEFAFFICQIRHFAIGPPPPHLTVTIVYRNIIFVRKKFWKKF